MIPMLRRDFDPAFYEFNRPILRQMNDLWDAVVWPDPQAWERGNRKELNLAYDIAESDDHYLLTIDVPGINKDDLNVELHGNRLRVWGERKSESKAQNSRFGRFEHIFTLPDGVTSDNVTGDYKDGVLRLSIAKPTAAKAVRIKIGDNTSGKSGFLRNLMGDKKSRENIEVDTTETKLESVTP